MLCNIRRAGRSRLCVKRTLSDSKIGYRWKLDFADYLLNGYKIKKDMEVVAFE